MVEFSLRRFCFSILAAGGLASALGVSQPASARVIAERDALKFASHSQISQYKIDHSAWSQFLASAVYDTGFPSREGVPRRKGGVQTGTRISTGSRARYRFESNRILLNLVDEEVLKFIAFYRDVLVNIMNENDYASFSSDEQLAYWFNLYNAIVIYEMAKRYPIARPASIRVSDAGNEKLFDAKLVTIDGTPLSLNDIRYGIVYRFWNNPDTIYGFWDGSIGGPNIQSSAFMGDNVDLMLELNARRFVNGLRGVSGSGASLRVSKVYENAHALFPSWPSDLYAHLREYAQGEVAELLAADPARLSIMRYDGSSADFNGGEVGRFGGSDNAAAALSNRGPQSSPDYFFDYRAPVMSNGSRQGASADGLQLYQRDTAELRRRRPIGSVSISDIATVEESHEQESAEETEDD